MPHREHGPTRGTLNEPTVVRKPRTWFSEWAALFTHATEESFAILGVGTKAVRDSGIDQQRTHASGSITALHRSKACQVYIRRWKCFQPSRKAFANS
jgi:hypothetical protein